MAIICTGHTGANTSNFNITEDAKSSDGMFNRVKVSFGNSSSPKISSPSEQKIPLTFHEFKNRYEAAAAKGRRSNTTMPKVVKALKTKNEIENIFLLPGQTPNNSALRKNRETETLVNFPPALEDDKNKENIDKIEQKFIAYYSGEATTKHSVSSVTNEFDPTISILHNQNKKKEPEDRGGDKQNVTVEPDEEFSNDEFSQEDTEYNTFYQEIDNILSKTKNMYEDSDEESVSDNSTEAESVCSSNNKVKYGIKDETRAK